MFDIKRKPERVVLHIGFKIKLSAYLVFVSLFGFIPGNLAAEPLPTLKEMVEKTITSNPEVQARYHKFLEAGFEQEVARGNFLPDASIVSTFRKQEEVIKLSNGTATPRMNNELVLRQMIFDGFATSNDVKRLGHAKRYLCHCISAKTTAGKD